MTNALSKIEFLNGTTLKLIAIISMTIDHIGFILLPDIIVLRYIGRLAFPIFAYMIAEGCYYTKNKKKYILLVLLIGVLCQGVMIMVGREFRLNIMFTLFFSIALIYLLQWAVGRKDILGTAGHASETMRTTSGKPVRWAAFVLVLLACIFIAMVIPKFFPLFHVDYGMGGILLPVVIYIPRERYQKLMAMAVWLVILCLNTHPFQWYCLFALIPLLFYNGKPGKYRLKYFFYFYYPVHLAILWAIKLF